MERDLDKKLYNDYLSGEKQAFEYLYNKYKRKIVYFIYNIVKDYQKAEDLMQETFIYIMQNKMKSNVSFKYYIYLVAKSKAFNYINIENRRNEITDEYLYNNENIESDVLDIITQEETQKELLESMKLLDEKYKNAVYLVNIEKLSYKETADILGETLQNTKSLVHRGKKQLRIILLKKGFDEMNKVAKVIIILLCVSIFLTGGVYGAVKIYNEYIKNQTTTESAGLYKDKNDITTYESDLRLNDMKMVEEEEEGMYYKIITNIKDYNKYKKRVSALPDMTEEDFKENFLAIFTWERPKRAFEKDCEIGEVKIENNTSYIILKQKENPNYEENSNILAGVISKEKLKENVKVIVEKKSLDTRGFAKVSDLPKDYSVEDAIKDGCFVIEGNILKSKDKTQFDDFIAKTKNGENDFIRIYEKDIEDRILIIDIEYKDDFYFCYTINLRNNQKWYDSYKQIDKNYWKNENLIFYGFSRIILNDKKADNNPIVIITDTDN